MNLQPGEKALHPHQAPVLGTSHNAWKKENTIEMLNFQNKEFLVFPTLRLLYSITRKMVQTQTEFRLFSSTSSAAKHV